MAKTDTSMSRRGFVQASVASAALLGLAGCAPENKVVETEDGGGTVYRLDPELDPEVEGAWIPAACWHNCGGRCANYAYVSDGVVLRQKTDDYHEDSWESPQQRSCPRGHSQQWQTFGVDRLKYPMKRKGWSPDNPQGELRGKDEWERISWDEALDYVASEIRKAKETYGNASILCAANNTKVIPNVLASYGGYTQWTDSASFGAFNENVAVIGLPLMGLGNSYDRLQMAKSEYVVLYGCNPSWASGGTPSWYFRHAQEAGVQFVFVGPEYNVTASMLDARWIRVRPGSDTAFLLAVAYEMMAADEAAGGSVIDQEFLDTHCVGYDAEHMPEDATLNENFKDYVQGAYDGTPKTAEWASEICGTPVEDIRWYAELMGKENKVGILHSFAAARCNNAESLPQLFYTIGAMGGHFSGEGHCIGSAYQGNAGNTGFSMFNPGTNMNPTVPNTEVIETLRAPEAWDAILQGTYRYTGNFSMYAGQYAPAEQRDIDIHVIYNENANCLQTWPGVMKGIEAFRKMDFVVTQGHFLNAVASYSDIVLPVTTVWEREDTSSGLNMFQREFIYLPKKVVDPLYEAQDDQWVAYELAKRLGLDADALFPYSGMQARYNVLASCTTNLAAEGRAPLFTITQEDIDAMGVQGQPQEGSYTLDDLGEKGYILMPRTEGDGLSAKGWDAFVADPEAAPLRSKSGKFEIYCEEWANLVNMQGRSTIKPYPTYIRPLNGYEDSFSDWENKVKGEYPYQITNPHYLRRSHTTFDSIPWLREAFANPVFINAADAAEKGVAEGDTVLVYNQYGKILRTASLTERLMPGVMALPHGPWVQVDEETGIDHAGSDNVLCAPVATGAGTSGYNTNLVNFEKYDGEALEPDSAWPQRVVEL